MPRRRRMRDSRRKPLGLFAGAVRRVVEAVNLARQQGCPKQPKLRDGEWAVRKVTTHQGKVHAVLQHRGSGQLLSARVGRLGQLKAVNPPVCGHGQRQLLLGQLGGWHPSTEVVDPDKEIGEDKTVDDRLAECMSLLYEQVHKDCGLDPNDDQRIELAPTNSTRHGEVEIFAGFFEFSIDIKARRAGVPVGLVVGDEGWHQHKAHCIFGRLTDEQRKRRLPPEDGHSYDAPKLTLLQAADRRDTDTPETLAEGGIQLSAFVDDPEGFCHILASADSYDDDEYDDDDDEDDDDDNDDDKGGGKVGTTSGDAKGKAKSQAIVESGNKTRSQAMVESGNDDDEASEEEGDSVAFLKEPGSYDDLDDWLPEGTEDIPNIIHVVFLARDRAEWPYYYFIHIHSALTTQDPEVIYVYYEEEPVGYAWERTIALPKVRPVKVDERLVHDFFGHSIKVNAHKADKIRLMALLKHGGIYQDLDVLSLKDFAPLRSQRFLRGSCSFLGREPTGLGNSVIGATPNCKFLRLWWQNYTDFNDTQWGTHSIIRPQMIAQDHPKLVQLLGQRAFSPYFPHTPDRLPGLFEVLPPGEALRANLTDSFSVHCFAQYNGYYLGNLTEDTRCNVDTLYDRLTRLSLPCAA